MATDQDFISLRIGSDLFEFVRPQRTSSDQINVGPDQFSDRELKLTITVTIVLS